MHITNNLLAAVFADSSLFCGKEDVIHAIIHHQLVKSGIPPQRIAREQALSGNRVDVALYGQEVNGDFATTQRKPLAAIEVKGGAYGYRNALKDEIDASGYCKDMAKLRDEVAKGVECWFLCVDMPELGRAVSPLKLGLVSEQCAAHGLSFAYYCQGEACFHVARSRQKLSQVPVSRVAAVRNNGGVDSLLDGSAPKLAALASQSLAVNGHEANHTALLYNCLRNSGLGVAQLSLETLFSFAARKGRMQERPDLVVFDADFDGRFNLYKGGDRRQSNDGHKLACINTIFEVKGSATMNKKSHKAVMQAYLADIQKLSIWREGAVASRKGTRVKTVFLGIDGRARGLPAESIEALIGKSRKSGSGLIYISRERIEALPSCR
jgi:hypothetical protein